MSPHRLCWDKVNDHNAWSWGSRLCWHVAEKRRNEPMPSTSAAPLASISLFLNGPVKNRTALTCGKLDVLSGPGSWCSSKVGCHCWHSSGSQFGLTLNVSLHDTWTNTVCSCVTQKIILVLKISNSSYDSIFPSLQAFSVGKEWSASHYSKSHH